MHLNVICFYFAEGFLWDRDDCWNECGQTPGPCNYCGIRGRCCRNKYYETGCDGIDGGQYDHQCVPDPVSNGNNGTLQLEILCLTIVLNDDYHVLVCNFPHAYFLAYLDVEVEEYATHDTSTHRIGCYPGEGIEIIRADYGVLPGCVASSGFTRLSGV